MMRNVALRIEYDGTDFVGSQWQNNGRSVQGELEGAWEQLTQERRRVNLAGRTDAGVHARGQVASVRTETHHDLATVERGLNAILPDDVAVLEAWEVAHDFHARHSAIRRDYRYLIDNGRVASPLLRRHAIHVPQRLDTAVMSQALASLLGTHDFAAFAGGGPPEGSTMRTCYAVSCTPDELWGQPLVAVDLAANAFLRHMVRNIVGTLLLVGQDKMDAAGFAETLASRDRRRAGRTAPAHGLYLMSVSYP
jgi:tRNA pseudouridine38-40 synthase